MTTHDKDSPPDDSVAAELAALGEPPAAATPSDFDVDADPDVRTVATLVAIAHPPASLPVLDVLSQRRVWKTLEGRLAAAAITPGAVVDPDHDAPAANAGPSWRGIVAGLAVAAVLILPRLSADDAAVAPKSVDRGEIEALGAQARAAVDTLGDRGGARARDLASSYAERLHAPGEPSP